MTGIKSDIFTKRWDPQRGFTWEEAMETAEKVGEAYKVGRAKSKWDFPRIILDPRGCEGYAIEIALRSR